MEELLVELVEPLVLVVYTVLVVGLTVIGLVLEWLGLSGAGAALDVPGIWLIYMGGVALFVGYLLTRDKLLPRLRAATA